VYIILFSQIALLHVTVLPNRHLRNILSIFLATIYLSYPDFVFSSAIKSRPDIDSTNRTMSVDPSLLRSISQLDIYPRGASSSLADGAATSLVNANKNNNDNNKNGTSNILPSSDLYMYMVLIVNISIAAGLTMFLRAAP